MTQLERLEDLLEDLKKYHAKSCELGYTKDLKDIHIRILKIQEEISNLKSAKNVVN